MTGKQNCTDWAAVSGVMRGLAEQHSSVLNHSNPHNAKGPFRQCKVQMHFALYFSRALVVIDHPVDSCTVVGNPRADALEAARMAEQRCLDRERITILFGQ